MGYHLRQRIGKKLIHRLQNVQAIIAFFVAVFNSYRLAELLPLLPLVACLGLLSAFPDWVLQKADSSAEWMMCLLLGGKCARLRDAEGRPTGQRCLYSLVGALDPSFQLPDDRLLCVPTNDRDKDVAFPSPAAAGWGNAAFLALCMKLAYEDWLVVRDVVNHEWRHPSLYNSPDPTSTAKRYLLPRFIQGCSFNFMQPIGAESSEELAHIHLDSDAVLLSVEDPSQAPTPSAAAAGAQGRGVAVILAFRGTEPLEIADFQSDFDAVPEAGEWGCLHPGFLLALGLDPNLNPYHQTLTTYTVLDRESPAVNVMAARPVTPYEVLRDLILDYMDQHPSAKLYVCGHSLGGALAVVFMGALMHDNHQRVNNIKSRVGALYTFGQPRVGDYEFLCHLQVNLLEPSKTAQATAVAGTAAHTTVQKAIADYESGSGGHHVEHATTASGDSKLKGLIKGHQEQDTAPPLTSRYIRVANTFDIVPHIPPTLCNLYQHGGDLLYLQMTPGSVKFLTEQPMMLTTGIWSSSLVKLAHYSKVLLGLKQWKGRDNYVRYGMRLAAVCLPFLIAGLNDHMPGDYCQHILNSDPSAWQPFKSRKRLSRWAHAVMFASALKAPTGTPLSAAIAAKSPAATSSSSIKKGSPSFTEKIQAQVVPLIDKAADMIAGASMQTNGPDHGRHRVTTNGTGSHAAVAPASVKPRAAGGDGSASASLDTAADYDAVQSKTAEAKAKLKGLAHRPAGSAHARP